MNYSYRLLMNTKRQLSRFFYLISANYNRTVVTLGWFCGKSYLPLDFVLCSSPKADKKIQQEKKLGKLTCGYRRQFEAMTKFTTHLETMVKHALASGIKLTMSKIRKILVRCVIHRQQCA